MTTEVATQVFDDQQLIIPTLKELNKQPVTIIFFLKKFELMPRNILCASMKSQMRLYCSHVIATLSSFFVPCIRHQMFEV